MQYNYSHLGILLYISLHKKVSSTHRVDVLGQAFSPVVRIGLLHLLTLTRVCYPLLWFRGGGGIYSTLARGRGDGEIPIPTREQTLWYSRYTYKKLIHHYYLTKNTNYTCVHVVQQKTQLILSPTPAQPPRFFHLQNAINPPLPPPPQQQVGVGRGQLTARPFTCEPCTVLYSSSPYTCSILPAHTFCVVEHKCTQSTIAVRFRERNSDTETAVRDPVRQIRKPERKWLVRFSPFCAGYFLASLWKQRTDKDSICAAHKNNSLFWTTSVSFVKRMKVSLVLESNLKCVQRNLSLPCVLLFSFRGNGSSVRDAGLM